VGDISAKSFFLFSLSALHKQAELIISTAFIGVHQTPLERRKNFSPAPFSLIYYFNFL
jgi:hypothetical protein